MSKIFRLHTGTTENIEHWQQLPNYIDHTSIDKIQDPSGLSAKTQITSIPTPFARMDLVKSAFLYVASNNVVDGTTIYHRMISDCLDIAEIFFNIEGFGNKVEILEWNSGIHNNGGVMDIEVDSDLGKLIHSTNPKHKLLGETLKMYLLQDKKHFNFSDLKHIYILNYKHGPEPLNIIGGTSPTTLFFSSANNLNYVDLGIANDKFFDGSFCPLHNRTHEFIKYIYTIQNLFPNFSEKFKGLNTYLDITYPLLSDSLKEAIKEIKKNSSEYYTLNYNNISVKSANNLAEIMGFRLKTKKYDVKVNTSENDFIIGATKNVNGDIPCALPIDAFNEELNYGGGKWQKEWFKNVPKFDKNPLDKRTLPNQVHVEYPYLTISDFLEPYIVKVPYPLDSSKFFNGNYEIRVGENDHGFMLPIKKEFFNYFSIQDLQGVVSNGKKMFEIKQLPGGVTVTLRVPIKKNSVIEYSRTYNNNLLQDKIQHADESNNLGVIVENQFTVAIYPFIKLEQSLNPHYRVLFVDRDVNATTLNYNYSLSFYKENNANEFITNVVKKERSSKHLNPKVSTSYYIVENQYEIIEVKNNLCTGILIPLFKYPDTPSKKFKFAIDFGTTNTHIEYKQGEVIKPFDITENDIQMGTLFLEGELTNRAVRNPILGQQSMNLIDIINEEFAPTRISPKESYKFPQRTVINDNDKFNADEANFALADFNIPFWYLKEKRNINSNITANLKWQKFNVDKMAERRTRAFLKQLMIMLRNKVILNGGDLKEAEIVWFYPTSMPMVRKNNLEQAWNTFYKRYFGDYGKIYKLSESFAPFYYYFNNESVKPNVRPAANIDIGGGTTDIVIYTGKKPIVLTSFKFASNSVFGDGYGYTHKDNGFVQKFEPIIKDTLSNTSAKNLNEIYNLLKEKTNSSIELCEFFFSLQENKLVKDNNINLSFSTILAKDDEMKIVFVLFYTAIIYHLAKLMKSKELEIPEYLTFSGNGAKMIYITNGSENLKILESFTKLIFAKIYNSSIDLSTKLKLVSNPKEITCKGGIEIDNYRELEDLENKISRVLIGTFENELNNNENIKYSELVGKDLRESVVNEVNRFIDFFFELNGDFNFSKNFDINLSSKDEYIRILKEYVANDLVSGIEDKLDDIKGNEDSNIEETLFFYPIKGCLNRLAYHIYSNK